MPEVTVPPGVEGLVSITRLPDDSWIERWERIILPEEQKERLLNHLVFSLGHRATISAVGLPVHGLVVLGGRPGTGKTTIAGGLADQAARALGLDSLLYISIDPHAYPSQLLGESQRSVARLFERTIPDIAKRGDPIVVLLDEVEALAVSRTGASLETNPVDVHRATDAVLAGLDRVSATCPNVSFVATSNFLAGVDAAFLSRADLIEDIGAPGAAAIAQILVDTLREVAPDAAADVSNVAAMAERLAEADFDARQVRKLVLRAIASRRELALHPDRTTLADLQAAFDAVDHATGRHATG